MSTVMDYEVKRPLTERINFRLLLIVGVFALLVGVPVFSFVRAQLSHGVQKHGDRLDVDLKSLGNFKFNDETGTIADIPPEYRELDGKKVALEGFMYAGNDAGDHVNHFQFVYNINKCCFNGPPLVQERVFAIVPGDGVVPVSQAVRLIGTLHINLQKDEVGKIEKLYTLNVTDAEQL